MTKALLIWSTARVDAHMITFWCQLYYNTVCGEPHTIHSQGFNCWQINTKKT